MKSIPRPDWTVHKTLQQYPTAAKIFIQLHTDCVGCPLARFCTLADVEKDFNLPTGSLVQHLDDFISTYPLGA